MMWQWRNIGFVQAKYLSSLLSRTMHDKRWPDLVKPIFLAQFVKLLFFLAQRMHQVIVYLWSKFQPDILKHSGDMDDFVSNTLQTNLCSFTQSFVIQCDKLLCLLINRFLVYIMYKRIIQKAFLVIFCF